MAHMKISRGEIDDQIELMNSKEKRKQRAGSCQEPGFASENHLSGLFLNG